MPNNIKPSVKDNQQQLKRNEMTHNNNKCFQHWIDDEKVKFCTLCSIQFNLTLRRHHCRACGQIFCKNCSNKKTTIQTLGLYKPVRVCHNCYQDYN